MINIIKTSSVWKQKMDSGFRLHDKKVLIWKWIIIFILKNPINYINTLMTLIKLSQLKIYKDHYCVIIKSIVKNSKKKTFSRKNFIMNFFFEKVLIFYFLFRSKQEFLHREILLIGVKMYLYLSSYNWYFAMFITFNWTLMLYFVF